VFAVVLGEGKDAALLGFHTAIEPMLLSRPDGVHIIPYYGPDIVVDFTKKDELVSVASKLNVAMQELEPADPWVKEVFGVDGCAEGFVCYPYDPLAASAGTVSMFEHFAFKVKGEKHSVLATKERVQIDPEVATSIDEFTRMFVTEARCDQGVAATGAATMKDMMVFLNWMSTDVEKESKDELEASGLTWDQVKKAVQAAARTWYTNQKK